MSLEKSGPRPRPDIGSTKKWENKIKICRMCGYRIDISDMCSYGCVEDCGIRAEGMVLFAIYAVTETLLREEDESGKLVRGVVIKPAPGEEFANDVGGQEE